MCAAAAARRHASKELVQLSLVGRWGCQKSWGHSSQVSSQVFMMLIVCKAELISGGLICAWLY
jgi:hypothetical protein